MTSVFAAANLQPAWFAGARRIKKMKRLLSFVCCLLILVAMPVVIWATATEEVSSTASVPDVSESAPSETPSEPSTPESEILSEAPTSSGPVSSDTSSEPESSSSDNASSSKPTVSSNAASQQDSANSTAVNKDKDENRGASILIFCYIIAVLIGICLVVLIFANVYIPIARKKKELKYFDDPK